MRRRLFLLAAAAVAALTLPAMPAVAVPLTWSAPAIVDHEQPLANRHAITSIACPADDFCLAADADGFVVRSANASAAAPTWSLPRRVTGGSIGAVSCPTTTLCAAVSGTEVAISQDGGQQWTLADGPSPSGLTSLSCPTASLCVAVDFQGNAARTTNPQAARPSWSTPQAIDPGRRLLAVSCTSSALCAAIDDSGNVLFTTDPAAATPSWSAPAAIPGAAGLTGIACPSTGLCVAVDDNGAVHRTTDPIAATPTWTSAAVTGRALRSVACPSASRCVASGAQTLLVTTNASAATPTWSETPVAGHVYVAAACAPSFCVAGTSEGRVSATTGAGAPASTWSAPFDADGTNATGGVACPSESLCVIATDAGRIASSTQPTLSDPAWRLTPVAGSWLDVACPSAGLCVAVGERGRIGQSSDPGAASPTWRTSGVLVGADLVAVSCATESFCLAVTSTGQSRATTSPAAGVSSWSAPAPIPGAGEPTGVSCPSTTLCAVSDNSGNVFTTTDPAAAQPTWAASSLSFLPQLDVACPTTGLCVTTDFQGNVRVTTDPTAATPRWSQAGRASGRLGCPSASFCAAAASGVVLTTTDPATPALWGTAYPLAFDDLAALDVGCASASLCVADDDDGRAAIGVAAPTNVAPPAVAGSAAVGETLAATAGAWTAAPAISSRWLRCLAFGCTPIASGPTYVVTSADVGATLRVEETAANAAGTVTAASAPTAVVPAPPPAAPGPPPPGPSATRRTPPSAAAIRRGLTRLLAVGGRAGRLGALAKRGRYTTTFSALTPGRLRVTWSTVPKAKKAKARTLATAGITIKRAGRVTVTLKLTKAFKRLAHRAKRLKIRVTATFTPTGRKAVTSAKTVTLKR
jgi:hypothetical protein